MTDQPTGWGEVGRRLWRIVKYKARDLKCWILRRQDPLDRPVEEWEVWEELRKEGLVPPEAPRRMPSMWDGRERARLPDGTIVNPGDLWGKAIRENFDPAGRVYLGLPEKEFQRPLFFQRKGMVAAIGVVLLLAGGGMWAALDHRPTPMSTRKVFNSGEVLTAADLNQAVSYSSDTAYVTMNVVVIRK